MKMRRGVLQGAWVLTAVCGALLPSAPVLAQAPAAEVVQAGNRIEKIIAAEQGGNVVLKLTMAKPLAAAPGSFSVASPARVAFDFPDTGNGLGRNSQQFNTGDLRSVNIVQVGDRTRLVLNLSRLSPYDIRLEDRDVLITLSAAQMREAGNMVSQSTQFAAPAPMALPSWMAVTPIPLVPPCTNSVSPFCRRPRSNTLLQTVKNVSGKEAASASDKPWGTGRHCATGATHSSA